MSFASPWLLLALLAIPLTVALLLLAERRRMRYAVRFTNVDVLAAVAGGRQWRRYVPAAVFLLALAAAAVALARPHVSTDVTVDRATVVLVIDHSGSMFAEDVAPSRLGAAQRAVEAFLDEIPGQVQVGLVVFAAEPLVAAPPTKDHELVRRAVESFGFYPVRGTAIGDALAAAVELGQRAVGAPPPGEEDGGITIAFRSPVAEEEGPRSPVSILFLSDGAQTRGVLEPEQGAALAAQAGIPVHTVSLGTPEGVLRRDFGGFEQEIPVPPDPETLRAVSEATGGRFFDAQTAESLAEVYGELGSSLALRPGEREVTSSVLAAAAALLVAAGLLSARWSPRFP